MYDSELQCLFPFLQWEVPPSSENAAVIRWDDNTSEAQNRQAMAWNNYKKG